MPMLVYKPLQTTVPEFVQFWSARYAYPKEELYDGNIAQELTEERILALFEWKNGTPLSAGKQASVIHNFSEHRAELERFRPEALVNEFLAYFAVGGAIWRIFWLHCWQPNRFPIYDQHVHRAMRFIQVGEREEIPAADPQKIASYINNYLPFHSEFDGIDGRSVDKALWAFGKFLKECNFPTVV